MVKLREAESQIIIDDKGYAWRPDDSDLLVAAIDTLRHCWGAPIFGGGGWR
jgi:hypothetical protein